MEVDQSRAGHFSEMRKWIITHAEGEFAKSSNPSSLQLCLIFVDSFARLPHQKSGAFFIAIFYS
jgi:hypothetical protein